MSQNERTSQSIADFGFKLENIKDIKKHGFVLIDEHEPAIEHKIEEIAEEKKIKTSDIAKLTNIARQSMNTIKKYKSKPSLDFALKMAFVLDIPVEDIFQLKSSAWVEPIKSSNDSGYYYDNSTDEVIFSADKNTRIKANRFEFFEIAKPSVKYTKSQAIKIMNRSNYDGGLQQIYQRIGKKTQPYQLKE